MASQQLPALHARLLALSVAKQRLTLCCDLSPQNFAWHDSFFTPVCMLAPSPGLHTCSLYSGLYAMRPGALILLSGISTLPARLRPFLQTHSIQRF